MLHRASRISRFNPLTRVNRASQAHRYALVTPHSPATPTTSSTAPMPITSTTISWISTMTSNYPYDASTELNDALTSLDETASPSKKLNDLDKLIQDKLDDIQQ